MTITDWLSGRSFSIFIDGIAIALRHSLSVSRVSLRLIVSPFLASITLGSKPLLVTFTSTTRPAATSAGAAAVPEEAGFALASFSFPQPRASAPRRREAQRIEAFFTREAIANGERRVKRTTSLCLCRRPRYSRAVRAAVLFALSALAIPTCASLRGSSSGDETSTLTTTASAASTASGSPVATSSATALEAAPPSAACDAGHGLFVLTSPETPVAGKPLRVVAVSEPEAKGTLVVRDGSGKTLATGERRGGPPYFWIAEIPSATAGSVRATVEEGGALIACKDASIAAEIDKPKLMWAPHVWKPEAEWTRATEDLFAAWIEKLFDAPLDEQLSWPILHDVLRDPARNFLHDHLGYGEDEGGRKGISIDPDCADLPYFLRAYFAFKLKLPFAYSGCTRGNGGAPPRCVKWRSIRDARSEPANDPPRAFGNFLRLTLADAVHSGNGRVPASSDEGDYYPVPLTASSLRPGTIFADPYGHVLIVVKRIAQTKERGGILLAVDGQPDGTVARRRFWRGNFLFALDPALGSAGFKRFRPIALEGKHHALTNDEIAKHPDYGDFGLDQYAGTVDDFYDKVEEALSPEPMDPERALLETIDALEEQVRGRVKSVQNGVDYFQKGGSRIDMPDGAEIFETTGPWEDFSTPSRDLRLLIAIDIVTRFPERVAKRASRFAMPAGKKPEDVRADLEARLRAELEKRKVSYARSDGSMFSLSLADVAARGADLEMAYNPNDCPEARWGAPKGSDEASTCRRHAGGDQRAKMNKARAWFHERRRPPRGA